MNGGSVSKNIRAANIFINMYSIKVRYFFGYMPFYLKSHRTAKKKGSQQALVSLSRQNHSVNLFCPPYRKRLDVMFTRLIYS